MYESTPEARAELIAAINRAFETFAPPPALLVSEWADQFRGLSSIDSAVPGKWSTGNAEYLRGVMDTWNDPTIQDVWIEASAQIGKTQGILNNTLGYIIDQDPCPVMVVEPTQDDCKEWSKDRLMDGLINATPCLRGKVREDRGKNSKNTTFHKRFAGGQLTVAWSNSKSRLASRPIRAIFFDEVDKYKADTGVSGNPLERGKARTKTFWNRKHYHLSTPEYAEDSLIDRGYLNSDRRRFYVPCPECGEQGVIAFFAERADRDEHPAVAGAQFHVVLPRVGGIITWRGAYLVCHKCGAAIDESRRPAMVLAGYWKAENPGGTSAGFHISALYSTLGGVTIEAVAKQFVEAGEDPISLKAFYNETLGLPWSVEATSLKAAMLLDRVEHYPEIAGIDPEEPRIPRAGLVLVGAVDVQGDRLECELRAFGEQGESWAICKQVFGGDPAVLTGDASPWVQLDHFLAARVLHESGVPMPIIQTLVDAGGHHTKQVHEFVSRRYGRGILSSIGRAGVREIVSKPKLLAGGAHQVIVGVDTAKEYIYRALSIKERGAGFCHFPDRPEYDTEHFSQLGAEKMVIKQKGFRPQKVWVKTRVRNEALDLFVYQLAALFRVRVQWPAIKANLERRMAEIEKPEPATAATPAPPKTQPAPASQNSQKSPRPQRRFSANPFVSMGGLLKL